MQPPPSKQQRIQLPCNQRTITGARRHESFGLTGSTFGSHCDQASLEKATGRKIDLLCASEPEILEARNTNLELNLVLHKGSGQVLSSLLASCMGNYQIRAIRPPQGRCQPSAVRIPIPTSWIHDLLRCWLPAIASKLRTSPSRVALPKVSEKNLSTLEFVQKPVSPRAQDAFQKLAPIIFLEPSKNPSGRVLRSLLSPAPETERHPCPNPRGLPLGKKTNRRLLKQMFPSRHLQIEACRNAVSQMFVQAIQSGTYSTSCLLLLG